MKINISFIREFKNKNSLLTNNLFFDFYLPDKNTLIEYNGIQHYEPVEVFGGLEKYKNQSFNDTKKLIYCIKNKINYLEISHKDNIIERLKNKLKI
ncbi:MAG: hypothetical protein RLZZ546_2306 [Bacteroidota bacterium]|jgi:hypothetical protein